MKIDNTVTYREVEKIEVVLSKGIDALLILQNYYDIKNLPISDLEEVQDMLFKKRLDFDKKLVR